MLLAGDVGGTKTALAVLDLDDGLFAPRAEATLPSGRYASLEALVRDFVSGLDLPIDRACFGVAGPVVAGTATVTNLPWRMNEADLCDALRLDSVRLLNDLEAIAWGVPFLGPADLRTLSAGQPVAHGPLAVIAPGTGLGEAFLTWDGRRYHAHPSEGGHVGFAPASPLELELLGYLQRRYDHVSCERVCSGIGLPNIYAFLKERDHEAEPGWLAEQLAAADDPTPVIVEAALAALGGGRPCPIAVTTLETFVAILAATAGNLALTVMATGGLYVGGGIPPRILPLLERPVFLERLRRKGRFAELLLRAPVHVILNPNAALVGAASYGLEVARA